MEATAQTAPAQQAAGKSADHGGVRPRPSLRPLLVLWDVVSVALVIGLHALVDGIEEQSAPGRSIAGLALLASGPLMVYLSGGYERTRRPLGNLPLELGGLAASAGFSTWLAAVVVSATGGRPLISSLTVIWVSIVVAWLIGRVAAAQVVRRRPEPALVVGSGVVARRLVELTLRHPEHGVRVVGVVDTAPPGLRRRATRRLPRRPSGSCRQRALLASAHRVLRCQPGPRPCGGPAIEHPAGRARGRRAAPLPTHGIGHPYRGPR